MNRDYALLFPIGWALFWLYWFIIATRSKGSLRSHSYTGIWIRLLLVVFILGAFRHANLYINGSTYFIIGTVMFALGLIFAVWARVYLGVNWGMPMTKKADPELVTSGPYKFVRHPIYSGILMAMLGTAVAANLYWLLIALASGIYFIYSAKKEEEYLAKQFPKAYRDYRQKSKMLIPYIL